MTAAEAYDALIVLQKSGIPERYHKRTMERLDFKEGSPTIEDQVKTLHEELLDLKRIATEEQDPDVEHAESENSESKQDPGMKEFLNEQFDEDESKIRQEFKDGELHTYEE